jgi:hypothetical protein
MSGLKSTEGIVALAAAALAIAALLTAVVLAVKLRNVRAAQSAVLGEDGARDLVVHAEQIDRGFSELREWVQESLARIEERVSADEERTDGCIAFRALVRYDAYGEMSGHQSSSLALLDSHHSGVVVSSILHREQARVYVKHIVNGESELELSPEERQAVTDALAPAQA